MRALLGLLVATTLLSFGGARAQEGVPPSPIVKAALVVDAPLVKRNQAIAAGVTLTIPEHWHVYWINPGDSGLATALTWTLPEGLSAGVIEWPAPERIEVDGLINYGYSNIITLPVTLTPTRDDVSGEVNVKASWLVCKDICIPESAELTARLAPNPQGAQAVAAARALAPQLFDGSATFALTPDAATLTITRANPWGNITGVRFSPIDDGIMANNPPATVKQVGNELTLTFKRGTADAINDWHGVLHYTQGGENLAWNITAKNTHTVATAVADASVPAANPMVAPVPPSFIISLLLAFVGGLVLNVMPCVLPILALKALALSKKAQASRIAAAKQGMSYTAGVVISFLLIAGGMLALKATGSAIGWGFQLQNPAFVGFLALVMVLVAANLLGLFELPVLFGEKATAVDDSKLRGSFLTGVLAVLVATPCTAPFMATAIGATLSFPTAQALAVFASLGLGMAAPFLIISLWPAARRLLPKPGAWMHRFKQILAVPMLATAAWLLFVLVQLMHPMTLSASDSREMYSAPRLEQLRGEGKPVLVDATAAWCLTCKVNERVALKPDAMQQFFREKNVTIMIADWTNADPAITEYLASFGRNGVPLVVYYPPHGEAKILPQILTQTIVREAIATP
jgi:DsbC/DsbD-like thiol-disulfide interchange protein/cytochrome c biogenesis protein CcdA